MKKGICIWFVFLMATGCVETDKLTSRSENTDLPLDEGFVVISDDSGIPACVANSLQDHAESFTYVPDRRFRDALFPWFEPMWPEYAQDLESVLSKRVVRERIRELGVRYLIGVGGSTFETEPKGAAIGAKFLGVFGAAWWNKETVLSVQIWDFENTSSKEEVKSTASGKAVMPMFMVPIPLAPATEGEACEKAAQKIAKFMRGNRSSQD